LLLAKKNSGKAKRAQQAVSLKGAKMPRQLLLWICYLSILMANAQAQERALTNNAEGFHEKSSF
jgi:hypothetical protein